MSNITFQSNQVAVAGVSNDLQLFDRPIDVSGRLSDIFFKIYLPVDYVRNAFRLEFNDFDFNDVSASDVIFHEISSNLFRIDPVRPLVYFHNAGDNFSGVKWGDASAVDQDHDQKSWDLALISDHKKDTAIRYAGKNKGMLLRYSTNPSTQLLKHEIAELAVRAHFEAPLDLIENEEDLILDVSGKNPDITRAFREQLRDVSYNIETTGNFVSHNTERPVHRGICESLFSSGMGGPNHAKDETDVSMTFINRIDAVMRAFLDSSGVRADPSANWVVDVSNDLYGIKIERVGGSDPSGQHVIMDFPFKVGDTIEMHIIYAIQTLPLSEEGGTALIGPNSTRKQATRNLREKYESRVPGYELHETPVNGGDLDGESIAKVGGLYDPNIVKDRYGPLFMYDNALVNIDDIISNTTMNTGGQYSFINRIVHVQIQLTDATYGPPAFEVDPDTGTSSRQEEALKPGQGRLTELPVAIKAAELIGLNHREYYGRLGNGRGANGTTTAYDDWWTDNMTYTASYIE